MFKIGDFSKVCRIPVSTLRYYADVGLLPPAQIDPFTGYRYYSFDQLPRLYRILALKDLNLTLEQIRQALDENLGLDEMRGMLRMRQAEIEQHIAEEQARLARVAARIKQIEQENNAMAQYDVILKAVEPLHVMALRSVIPTPEGVAHILMAAFPMLVSRGIQPNGAPFMMYHDTEFKGQDIDVEVAFPVSEAISEPITLEDGRAFRIYDLPGATVASVVYEGSYDALETPYTAIGHWIETNGYHISGAPREIYLRAPEEGVLPLTEIQYPVEKAADTRS